ncbi:MAG: SDR family NAD(P)-dependent oxidoreductase [Acidimicrobiia bacterium]
MTNTTNTALVTGANSGLGFEAAAQLAEQGYRNVIITARTDTKAEAARDQLAARTGLDVFETLTLDHDDLATVESAITELAERGRKIDVLLLNAGASPTKVPVKTAQGIEGTVASTLIGHHLLTTRLLEKDLLGDKARIIISGSESARGDVPMFHPLDVDAFAQKHFDGDLEAAIEAQIRMEPPAEYKPSNAYATAKVFVAWWAAQLSQSLPTGMTVNAVSPGSTPETNAARNAPFFMRRVMMPMFKLMPGKSHSVADGAARYLEAVSYDDDITGRFFASPPKKMVGPLIEVAVDHLDNPEAQRALFRVANKVATPRPVTDRKET